MKAFLKIFLLVVLALVAIKLLPLTLALGCLLGLAVVALLVIGVSALAGMIGIALVVVAALAPLWIPVLATIGLISLLRRGSRRGITI